MSLRECYSNIHRGLGHRGLGTQPVWASPCVCLAPPHAMQCPVINAMNALLLTIQPTTALTYRPLQDAIKVQIHDKQVEELERSLDPPLNVLFIRQLLTLRDKV